MEPLSITQLQTMHRAIVDKAIEDRRLAVTKHTVSTIYNSVKCTATRGKETKYVHKIGYVVDTYSLNSVMDVEIIITIDDVKEAILSELHRLFPGCNVQFVERRPEADIFGGAGRRRSPNSDGIDRAFVVDWS